jgi:arginyl-tRNA synthetase
VKALARNAVDRLAEAVGDVAGHEVELERPKDSSFGDYATNVALQRARTLRRAPRELAEELAVNVIALPLVERAEVAGPGFVNIWLTDAFFVEALEEIGEDYGAAWAAEPERIQVELVSANPTGPITVASGRNGAYGDSVARMLEFAGHTVEREYYYNDSGTQMDRFRASVDAVRRGEEPPQDGYHGDYIAELARADRDPVPLMLERIEATMRHFRIGFDSWAKQSTLEHALPAILAELPTYEQDGALFVRSTEFGDEKDRVLIRSAERGGLPTYEAADIAYLKDKFERGFERAIYVLGADHHGVAGWYAVIARMLGYDPERVEVLLYQLVHLSRGGERTKMAKRRGDVVFLDEFMDEIGVDAARWYLVNRGPDQTIEIDIDLAAEKTQKNPVYYVQYAHARIAGILRGAPTAAGDTLSPGGSTLEPQERELVKRLADFPTVVREATERRGPQMIPFYAIRLADDFHRFYHDIRVLGSAAEPFRLALCRATQRVIARCLDLIGVEAPERM